MKKGGDRKFNLTEALKSHGLIPEDHTMYHPTCGTSNKGSRFPTSDTDLFHRSDARKRDREATSSTDDSSRIPPQSTTINVNIHIDSHDSHIERPAKRARIEATVDSPIHSVRVEEFEGESDDETPQFIDGVDTEKLRKWVKSDDESLVGRMVKFLLTQTEPILMNNFKSAVSYTGSDKSFYHNIQSGCSIGAFYGKIWIHSEGLTQINPRIRRFLSDR